MPCLSLVIISYKASRTAIIIIIVPVQYNYSYQCTVTVMYNIIMCLCGRVHHNYFAVGAWMHESAKIVKLNPP